MRTCGKAGTDLTDIADRDEIRRVTFGMVGIR